MTMTMMVLMTTLWLCGMCELVYACVWIYSIVCDGKTHKDARLFLSSFSSFFLCRSSFARCFSFNLKKVAKFLIRLRPGMKKSEVCL